MTAGTFVLSEDIACTYMDLDALIETAGLTDKQYVLLMQMMDGYSIADISSVSGKDRKTLTESFNSAVKKICLRNLENWKTVYAE